MIKTYIKTDNIKNKFNFCNEIYSIIHSKVSESSFEIEFREIQQNKTYLQLKAIHKLCQIYCDYISEALGFVVSFENAKEDLKYKIGYTRLANKNEAFAEAQKIRREKELAGEKMKLKDFQNLVLGLEANYKVPASFRKASLKEMQELIEKIHELGRDRGWHKLILTNQDMQSLINSYK